MAERASAARVRIRQPIMGHQIILAVVLQPEHRGERSLTKVCSSISTFSLSRNGVLLSAFRA
jgi:hypothetical protein